MKKVEREENYQYSVYFSRDCQELGYRTPASRQGKVQSYTDWALKKGGNVVSILHPNKHTLQLHILQDNIVWITTYDEDGDCVSVSNPICIEGMCIYDLYGEAEHEEWEVNHVDAVLAS